jgi:hypothetical protein
MFDPLQIVEDSIENSLYAQWIEALADPIVGGLLNEQVSVSNYIILYIFYIQD